MVIVRAGVLVAALLLIMVPALISSAPQSLQVHTNIGELVWCVPVREHDTVQLQFTHSMYGGYVRERWTIAPDNTLLRVRFVTENAAAAEYYATNGTTYRADDGYVVPVEPLWRSELVVRVNSRGNHVLSVDDQTVHLTDLLPQSTQVRITVEPETCD